MLCIFVLQERNIRKKQIQVYKKPQQIPIHEKAVTNSNPINNQPAQSTVQKNQSDPILLNAKPVS